MAPSSPAPPSSARTSPRAVTESPVRHLSDERAIAAQTRFADLARRAAGGDRGAMERLLLEAQEVAWRFSRTVCGHTEDAEDAMQEALVQTFRFVSRLRDPAAFRPWLYRTVRNACLMSRRRHVGEPTRMLSLDELLPTERGARLFESPEVGKDPEQLVEHAGLRRRLNEALARLPPTFRVVVFLREMEGLSTREASAVLGVSEDSVKARLHRARLFLQRELAAAGERRARPRRRTRTTRRTVRENA
jgi:RNA polymerase sigma-70 factor (ECF subfamily)